MTQKACAEHRNPKFKGALQATHPIFLVCLIFVLKVNVEKTNKEVNVK